MTQTQTSMSYWGNCGKYEKECKILDEFVPDQGGSNDKRIEMYRVARNVYYDVHNNGGCNLSEGWARNDEYKILMSKFPSEKLEEYMEAYEKYQNRSNSDDDDEYIEEPSECLYNEACEACDDIMNRVIEWIMSTDFFETHKL